MEEKRQKKTLRKIWQFVWEDNSIWSWIVNIILAFIIIKFIVYPLMGLVLSTSYPIVAVVSPSMEHNANFENWWQKSNSWYIANNITKEMFLEFPLKNGFNKGDIIILSGAEPKDIKIGAVIVFKTESPDPIIHRVVNKWQENNNYYFQTKGDNNQMSIKGIVRGYDFDETRINQNQIIGKAGIKIPLLGYIKIWFVDFIQTPYCRITGNVWPCRR